MHLKFTWGICLLTLVIWVPFSKSFSQDGKIDSSFGTNGRVFDPPANFIINGGNTISPRILVTSDGKILHLSNTTDGLLMIRYLPDGAIDVSFGNGGTRTIPSANILDAILLSDQKFLVLSSGYVVRRFTSEGIPDSTFDGDGITNSLIGGASHGFAVQTDGKIVVVGSGVINGDETFMAVRYNEDGSVDNSFDADGVAQFNFNPGIDYATAVAVQTDGKIVVAGIVSNSLPVYPGQSIFFNEFDAAIIRYLPNGSLDPDFGTGGTINFITSTYSKKRQEFWLKRMERLSLPATSTTMAILMMPISL